MIYHLVLNEEDQALDALEQLVEAPPAVFIPPFIAIMINQYDDPILDKPEFAALRAELRAKVGWN